MNLMIDLETFSIKPNAVITQVGVVVFDTTQILSSICVDLTLTEQILDGCAVDEDTVSWWRSNKEAHSILCSGEPVNYYQGLENIRKFIVEKCPKVEGVWAHGASFDLPIIENGFRNAGIDIPWKYSKHRDTRTLYQLAKDNGWQYDRGKVSHNALDDATHQAEMTMSALKWLSKG